MVLLTTETVHSRSTTPSTHSISDSMHFSHT